MANDQTLRYTIVFDKKTGAVIDVVSEVDALTESLQQMEEASAAAGEGASAEMLELEQRTEEATLQTGELTAEMQAMGEVSQEELAGVIAQLDAMGAGIETAGEEAAGTASAFEEVGDKGADGLGKIESRLVRVGLNLALMQLALQGIMTVVKQDEGYQQLQKTFEDTAGTVLNDLAPGIHLITTGLSGVLGLVGSISALVAPLFSTVIDSIKAITDYMVGSAAFWTNLLQGNVRGAIDSLKDGVKEAGHEFDGLGNEWKTGLDKAVSRFGEAIDTMGGTRRAFTKEIAAIRDTEFKEEMAHNDAVLKVQLAGYQVQAQAFGASYAQKRQLLIAAETAEINTLQTNETIKQQLLRDKLNAKQIDERSYRAQAAAEEQAFEDERTRIANDAANKRTALAREETTKLAAAFNQTSAAFVSAVAKDLAASQTLSQGLHSGAAAIISDVTKQGATVIESYGAQAAAAAFFNAVAATPGPFSWIAGAAAAAKTLAFYDTLAIGVSVVGDKASSAAGAGGGGSSSGGGGGGGGGSTSAASSSPSVSPGPAGAVPSTSNSGGGGGQGNVLVLNVYLDSQPILRSVQNASFNGQIQIYAGAITPN